MLIKRILIVGLGSIGKLHLRLAREIVPDAKIAVLKHKPYIGIPEGADCIFFNIADAIKFSPQLAVIANPSSFHVSTALPLARAGVNLLVEKPLSTSIYGVLELLNLSRSKNCLLGTGYNLRFIPSLQKFKEMLDEKIIGDIWSVRSEVGQFLPSWRPGTDYRHSVSAQKSLGGGVLLELSHEIDYLSWIFGDIEWVQAAVSQASNLEINVEDSAHLILGLAPNNSNKSLIVRVDMDFIRHDTTRLCTAIGEFGSLRWNGILGTVEIFKPGDKVWTEIFKFEATRNESYIAQWKNIITAINHGLNPLVTGVDGYKVLQIVEAAREAAKTKRQVKVKLIKSAEYNKL